MGSQAYSSSAKLEFTNFKRIYEDRQAEAQRREELKKAKEVREKPGKRYFIEYFTHLVVAERRIRDRKGNSLDRCSAGTSH